jgi:hypothetical protein
MDVLESKDKDGNIIQGEHLRMKGIPNQSLKYECNNLNISSYDLYSHLFETDPIGKPNKVKFDLLCGGNKCSFQFNKDFSVSSRSDFMREVSF